MTNLEDEIERLKIHKIPTERSRRRLPTVGQAHPFEPSDEELTEATGGSGESSDVPHDVLEERILESLRSIFDPEIPVNIYELGLIYGIDIRAGGEVEIRMTLTAPACPVAGHIVKEVAEKIGRVEGVATSHVELVWDPPWTPELMTDDARLELGLL